MQPRLPVERFVLAGVDDIEAGDPSEDGQADDDGRQHVGRVYHHDLATECDPGADWREHQRRAEPEVCQ